MKNVLFNIARVSSFFALMLCFANGASAQVLTQPKNVKFFNQAGYVAQFVVSYNIDVNPNDITIETASQTTKKLAVGESQTITMPVGTKNVKIEGFTIGITGARDKLIFSKSYADASKIPACFKTYGTLFDPKWNNNCN